MVIASLRQRQQVEELMDAPDVDLAEHREALAGLRRINDASGTVDRVASPIIDWARRNALTKLCILDVACGGGDVPVGVARQLTAAGIEVSLTFMDKSDTALAEAAALARSAGLPSRTAQGEAPDGLPHAPGGAGFDVITNSLFLHHLAAPQVVATLAGMRTRLRAGGLLVVSDLRRSFMGWLIAWAGCRVLSRSRLVHHDGPVSVKAAWTLDELRAMARDAGLEGVRVERSWPWRMRLAWQRPSDRQGGGEHGRQRICF